MSDARISRRNVLRGAGIAGVGGLAALMPAIPVAAEGGTNSIIGAWHVDFATNTQSFQVLTIYTAGGEVAAVSSNPPSSGSPAYGAWRRAGDRQYLNTHEFFAFDPSGNLAGTVRVRLRVTLDEGGNSMSGQGNVDFQPAGSPTFFPAGTAHLTGSRISPMPPS